MPNEQLLNYIDQARKSGKNDDQIRQELLGTGWQSGDIEEALKTNTPNISKKSFKFPVLIPLVSIVIIGGYFASAYYLSIWPFGLSDKATGYIPVSKNIPKEVADWKSYTNENFGFKFRYPKELVLTEDNSGTVIALNKTKEEQEKELKETSAYSGIGIVVLDNFSHRPASELVLKNAFWINPEFSEEQITIGDLKVIRIGDKESNIFTTYYFEYNDRVYVLQYHSENTDVLKNIIITFEFDDIKSRSPIWKTYSFNGCGFEFKLPPDWTPVENKDKSELTNEKVLTLAPVKDWAFNYQLLIFITDNPSNLPYEKLFGIEDRPEFAQEYYSDKSNITIGGVPAKLTYDVPGETYSDKSIVIPRDKYYLSIWEPREQVIDFDHFLSGFKLIGSYNSLSCEQEIKEKSTSTGENCPPSDFECLGNKAAKENNPNICQDAGSSGYASDHCFSQMAFATSNQLYCERVKEETYQTFCYERVAVKTKNPSLCEKISLDYSKNSCYEKAYIAMASDTLDPKYCDKASEYLGGSWVCYRDVAIKSDNIKICDKILSTSDIKWCYRDFAIYKNNCSLLQSTPYSQLQTECSEDLNNGMKIIVN